MAVSTRRLPIADERPRGESPLHAVLSSAGLTVMTGALDRLLEWGAKNSLWVFPMATSCCGIELMAAAASRVDLDRMGTIVRASPRQADVMVVAGTITVKMAPRVLALWEQMPDPKWCIAMGSCAISGDFYRNLYSVVPGIDTVLPVDVYVPGCPPNPEALMHGLLRLQEKIALQRQGKLPPRETRRNIDVTRPSVPRVGDPQRSPEIDQAQQAAALQASSLDRADAPLDDARPQLPSLPEAEEDLATLFAELGVTEIPKDMAPLLAPEQHVDFARRLQAMGYKQLVYVVASHFTKPAERFEVAYAVRTLGHGSKLAAWRVALGPHEAAPSLVGVYAGADWQEREQWDLLGVPFSGHPDLRRIMLPEGYHGHPLRKDFRADEACPPWR